MHLCQSAENEPQRGKKTCSGHKDDGRAKPSPFLLLSVYLESLESLAFVDFFPWPKQSLHFLFMKLPKALPPPSLKL